MRTKARYLPLVLGACLMVGLAVWEAPAQQAQNPIQVENARAGTTSWHLNDSADNQEIKGYANLHQRQPRRPD